MRTEKEKINIHVHHIPVKSSHTIISIVLQNKAMGMINFNYSHDDEQILAIINMSESSHLIPIPA